MDAFTAEMDGWGFFFFPPGRAPPDPEVGELVFSQDECGITSGWAEEASGIVLERRPQAAGARRSS